MTGGNTRRVVVIRDIPSNLIEEAIFVLKNNAVVKDGKNNSGETSGTRKKDNSFLIKEAELIINNCIREGKLQGETNRKPVQKKPGMFADRKAVNIIINTTLIGSIALLVFLLTRMV